MKKIILNILLCACTVLLYGCACKKDEVKIEYNDEEAVAEGTVDLTGDEPEIFITSIKAKKGAEIDYLSGVVIENEEDFDDLKIWVDESAVDIYEPGDYKAKYTFEYDGKSTVYEITVTILDEEVPASESIAPSSSDVVGDNETKPSGNSGNVSQETKPSVDSGNDASSEKSSMSKNEGTTKPQATTTKPQATTTKSQITTKPQATTTKPQATTKPSGGDSSTTQTTRREIITSSQNSTTKEVNIGYAYIELLSGSTISIKTTTARYIVSTRTDISYNTKNGVEYKVSKLIITYNTGEERTLETVEEKCK